MRCANDGASAAAPASPIWFPPRLHTACKSVNQATAQASMHTICLFALHSVSHDCHCITSAVINRSHTSASQGFLPAAATLQAPSHLHLLCSCPPYCRISIAASASTLHQLIPIMAAAMNDILPLCCTQVQLHLPHSASWNCKLVHSNN